MYIYTHTSFIIVVIIISIIIIKIRSVLSFAGFAHGGKYPHDDPLGDF